MEHRTSYDIKAAYIRWRKKENGDKISDDVLENLTMRILTG